MKLLYIGVYRDGTGWGQAAIDYMLSLDAAGVEVVARPLKLNATQHEPPARILELEAREARGCDVVVQHVLPHQMDFDGHFASNVALYASETSNFKDSAWASRLNCMDKALVINRQMVDAARTSGVTIPVSVVPHATNIERFMQSYEPLDILKPYRETGDFLFYFVGELVRRKNLSALIQAFHLEFDPSEPVQLVIKTNQSGVSKDDVEARVRILATEMKEGLKLHGGRPEFYKEEVLVLDRLTDHGILRLHSACDCFVMPSYGEAWCLPAFDAMAMGRTPIVTACTGFLDYLSDCQGWLVPARQEPVCGATDTFSDLFTGNEQWWSIDVPCLRRAMREAYSNKELRISKGVNGVERAHDFTYHNVGHTMRRLLDGELAR